MWGMYILEIVFGSLFAICLILILFSAICCKIHNKYKLKEPVKYIGYRTYHFIDKSELDIYSNNYSGSMEMIYSIETPEKELEEKAKRIIKDSEEKHSKWEAKKPKFCSKVAAIVDKIDTPFIITTIFIFAIFLILSLIIICTVGSNPGTILKYQNMYSMIEEAINNGTDLENIAITQTKIEFNTWLVDVKTSLERWGNWSLWYLWKDQIIALNYLI